MGVLDMLSGAVGKAGEKVSELGSGWQEGSSNIMQKFGEGMDEAERNAGETIMGQSHAALMQEMSQRETQHANQYEFGA